MKADESEDAAGATGGGSKSSAGSTIREPLPKASSGTMAEHSKGGGQGGQGGGFKGGHGKSMPRSR